MADTGSATTSSPGRTERLRVFLSSTVVVVSLVLGGVAGIHSGTALARLIATNEEWIIGPVVDPDSLYHLGLQAVTLDISNSGFVADLNRGPLEITQDHVDRVLHATYEAEDTSAKLREVHGAILEFISTYPERPIFAVSIEEERPILADSLGRILLQQYAELPDCALQEDLGTLVDASGVKLFGGSGDDFFFEEHPDCRPFDVVATRVEEGIEEEVMEMAETGPDSVDAFPEDPDDQDFATKMATTQKVFFWTQLVWSCALLLIALGGSVITRRYRVVWQLCIAYGVGVLLFGLAAVILAPSRVEAAFANVGTVGEASEIWGDLGHRGAQSLLALTGTWSLMIGVLLILIGSGIGFALKRHQVLSSARE